MKIEILFRGIVTPCRGMLTPGSRGSASGGMLTPGSRGSASGGSSGAWTSRSGIRLELLHIIIVL